MTLVKISWQDLKNWINGRKKCAQCKNWIGKSQGLLIRWALKATADDVRDTHDVCQSFDEVVCYSTRPDTLFGASFLALSVDHPIAQSLAKDKALAAFIESCRSGGMTTAALETAEKQGFCTSLVAVHPLMWRCIFPFISLILC